MLFYQDVEWFGTRVQVLGEYFLVVVLFRRKATVAVRLDQSTVGSFPGPLQHVDHTVRVLKLGLVYQFRKATFFRRELQELSVTTSSTYCSLIISQAPQTVELLGSTYTSTVGTLQMAWLSCLHLYYPRILPSISASGKHCTIYL